MKNLEIELQEREETPKELVENIELEGTPFIARRIENKWFLTCGKYKCSPMLDNIEEAKENAKTITWDRIITVMLTMKEADTNTQTQIN